jgi:hypothetical protein
VTYNIRQPGGKAPNKHDTLIELRCPHCGRHRFHNKNWGDFTLTLNCHYCEGKLRIKWTKQDRSPRPTWGEGYLVSNKAHVTQDTTK